MVHWGERERAPLSGANGNFVGAHGCMVLYTANALSHLFQRHVLAHACPNLNALHSPSTMNLVHSIY